MSAPLQPSPDIQADTPSEKHDVFDALTMLLTQLAEHNEGDDITLGALLIAMKERAYGFILFLLALPCCVPFLYLLPQIVALPMLYVIAQMALGRQSPHLPRALSERRLSLTMLQNTVKKAKKNLGWIALLSHARFSFLTRPPSLRFVGALLLLPALSILVPLPSTNTVPGIGVTIAAIGLIERDGLALISGLLIGFLWVSLLFIGGPAFLYWLISLL